MRSTINTETRLIQAGIELAKQHGLNFTVRQLCAQSKINLGLFHYYFKNKDSFDKALIYTVYNQMLAQVTANISEESSPRKNIEAFLFGFHRFIGQNRMFISALLGTIFSGNKKILEFLINECNQHVPIIIRELKKASLSKRIQDQNPVSQIAALVPPITLPQVVVGLAERMNMKKLPFSVKLLKQAAEDEKQVQARIKVVLDGIFGE